jgi:hypothetical protein
MNMYKDNYEALLVLPLVQKLKETNRKLKTENAKLLRAFMNLLSMVEPAKRGSSNKKAKRTELRSPTVKVEQDVSSSVSCAGPVSLDDGDSVEIVVPEKTPNIVYQIIDEDEEANEEEEAESADANEEAEEEEEEDADAGEAEDADAGEAEEEEAEDADANEAEEEAGEAEEEEEDAEEDADAGEVEEEEEKVSADAEEEEEVKEVIINKKTYYTDDEKNGTIYDVDENGDVSLEVGKFVKGVAKFY